MKHLLTNSGVEPGVLEHQIKSAPLTYNTFVFDRLVYKILNKFCLLSEIPLNYLCLYNRDIEVDKLLCSVS